MYLLSIEHDGMLAWVDSQTHVKHTQLLLLLFKCNPIIILHPASPTLPIFASNFGSMLNKVPKFHSDVCTWLQI